MHAREIVISLALVVGVSITTAAQEVSAEKPGAGNPLKKEDMPQPVSWVKGDLPPPNPNATKVPKPSEPERPAKVSSQHAEKKTGSKPSKVKEQVRGSKKELPKSKSKVKGDLPPPDPNAPKVPKPSEPPHPVKVPSPQESKVTTPQPVKVQSEN